MSKVATKSSSKKSTKAVKAAKVAKATSKAKAQKVAKGTTKSKAQQPAAKPQTANPYRVGGGYWASVEALRALGVGKMHGRDAILSAVRKAMGEGWKAFAAKGNRNEETGKDAEGRAWQNVAVVARKDYGKPLHVVGYEVRFDGREKTAGLFKL